MASFQYLYFVCWQLSCRKNQPQGSTDSRKYRRSIWEDKVQALPSHLLFPLCRHNTDNKTASSCHPSRTTRGSKPTRQRPTPSYLLGREQGGKPPERFTDKSQHCSLTIIFYCIKSPYLIKQIWILLFFSHSEPSILLRTAWHNGLGLTMQSWVPAHTLGNDGGRLWGCWRIRPLHQKMLLILMSMRKERCCKYRILKHTAFPNNGAKWRKSELTPGLSFLDFLFFFFFLIMIFLFLDFLFASQGCILRSKWNDFDGEANDSTFLWTQRSRLARAKGC